MRGRVNRASLSQKTWMDHKRVFDRVEPICAQAYHVNSTSRQGCRQQDKRNKQLLELELCRPNTRHGH